MNSKLSVIIPAYNAEKTIKRCLDSIINQTYSNLEIIVVDDGSKDNTFNIINEYMSLDNRIIGIHTENKGVSSARNTGISKATGKYLSFVDSDDYLQLDYLELLLNEIDSSNVDIIFGGLSILNNDKITNHLKLDSTISNINIFWNKLAHSTEIFGYVWGRIYKTNIIMKYSILFNTTMYSQEDLDFNLSYFNYCNSMETVDSYGYIYDYVPSKRIPPYFDFIANQIKLFNIASEKVELEKKSIESIEKKIQNFLYCYLYEFKSIKDLKFKINSVLDNNLIIKFLVKMENVNFFTRWLCKNQVYKMFIYLTLRKSIGKIKKKFKY